MAARNWKDEDEDGDSVSTDDYTITREGEWYLITLSPKHIWDGADLSLLRDLILRSWRGGEKSIGIGIEDVQSFPSGFFGLLYHYLEIGVNIRLYNPHPKTMNFIWFQQFFIPITLSVYQLQESDSAWIDPDDTDPDEMEEKK